MAEDKKTEIFTFGALLAESVKKYGDRPAMGWVGEEGFTYKDLGEKVEVVVKLLFQKGVRSGDRVAILSENQPHWGVVFFAIASLGAIAVPIMPDFKNEQIRHILDHSGAKIIFVSKKQILKMESIKSASEFLVLLNDFSFVSGDIAETSLKPSVSDFSERAIREDDTAVIVYTSGTMGRLKGVILTHKNIIADARASIKCASLTSEYRSVSILPLAHMIELTLGLVAPLMGGASIYYLKSEIDENVLADAFKKVRPTLIVAVPLLIEKIYKNKILPQFSRNDFIKKVYAILIFRKILNYLAGQKLKRVFGGKLKLFSMGGSSLDSEVEKFLCEAGFPYALGYGLTEAAPLITGPETAEKCLETPFGSSGLVLTGVEIKIFNPDEDGVGEILSRGKNITRGYYNEENLTRELFTSDGWLKTGDLGKINQNGFLFVKGRLKNVIIRSDGRNVYPEELENLFSRQKYVDGVLVREKDKQIVAEVNLNLEHIKQDKKEKEIEEVLENIRGQVNRLLPDFSRINKIVNRAEAFNLTATKKIKRYSPEETEGGSQVEIKIKKTCAEILNKKEIDVNASFYDLGADSLDIIRFFQKLKEEFPGKVSLPDIFANATISKLAKFINEKK